MMRSKAMLACLMAGALGASLMACSDDDSTGNNNNTVDLCGNGSIDFGEDCDGTDIDGQDCDSLGMTGGDVTCTATCTFDLSTCTGCGNGEIEVGEICDGPALDGQTCADVGAFTGGTLACNATCDDYVTTDCTSDCPITATDVTGSIGSTTTVNTSTESDDFTGSCGGEGAPDTLLSFIASDTTDYVISTVNPGTDYDTILMAFTDCTDPTGSELDCNDDAGGGLQSTIIVSATAGQIIYVVIDGYDGGGAAEVSISPIVCGDGNVAAGVEQCDDGNTSDGDGCAADCTWECTDDGNEDDDSEAAATALTGTYPLSGGGVLCPGDSSVDYDMPVDFFTLSIPVGQVIDAVITAGTLTDCTEQQLSIQFLDPGLVNDLGVATSDGTDCPSVQGVANRDGVEVVMVIFANNATAPPQDYNFTLTTRAIVCGDSIADPGEACDDGNSTAGDGCENDCTLTPLCNMTADEDLGTLTSGTGVNAQVDLTAESHSYPDLSCVLLENGSDGEDYMYSFTVTTAGTLTIDVDHTGGDVMYGLFADDGSCTETSCTDLYPDVTGQISATVAPGSYRLVAQTWGPGNGANVSVTLTAP
jgi:cysteine-rich repeat protein